MKNKKNYSGIYGAGKHLSSGAQRNGIINETFENISKLDVNRGNLKGFLFENRVSEELNSKLLDKGFKAVVLDDNGIADIAIIDMKSGKVVKRIQAKCGYEGQSVKDFTRYVDDGQTLVINNDADKFGRSLDNRGIKYEKSSVTDREVSRMADAMKKEGKLLNSKNAKLTSYAYKTKEVVKNCHTTGVSAAKSGACFGAGMSLGSNIVDVFSGDKSLEEATVDIAKDTVVAGATGYVTGAATTALTSTAIGGTIASGVSSVGAAVGSTAIGGAAATVVGGISSAGAAVGGAMATGITGVGTALGGAATAVGATTVGGAIVAGTAAVGAVAVAAAPVVAVGAAVGVVWSLGRKLFGD